MSDPREAIGHCASVLKSSQIFDGNYPVTATGGVCLLTGFDSVADLSRAN